MTTVLDDAERLTRCTLSLLSEPGDAVLGELVARCGPGQALSALNSGSAVAGLPARHAERYRARLAVAAPAELAARADAVGARFVCPGDLEWPTQLDVLGSSAPLGLWVRGRSDLRRLALRSVAIVGARACTAYGRQVAADLAAGLAARGVTVVSGAAFGVDGAAQIACLNANGNTVGVLACGVDVSYPRGHAALLDRIAADGLLVSEHPPGTTVTRYRFLERNRIIAALTRGTVVVEAALRSGALSTANRARSYHRHVMAVPGPVTSAMSAGCHELLRVSGASVVTDAADVLDLIGTLGDEAQPRRRGPEGLGDGLGSTSLRVLDSLPSRSPAQLDDIARDSALDIPTVLRCLGELETIGLIQRQDEGWSMVDGR